MNIKKETHFILDKYNIRADKSLGQNFLVNQDAIDGIIAASKVGKTDYVIEIGPGLGTLTHELLNQAGFVTCIELDNKMIDILHDRFSLYDNFELIHDDVLKVDLKQLIENNLEKHKLKNVRIVANLPYYITTPIIMKLLEEKLGLNSITVMIQKEVAQRLTAVPGTKESGAITYSIYYYTEPQLNLNVDKSSFIPQPKVDSSVITLNILLEPRVKTNNPELMFKIIKASFMQKRKTLVNGLVTGGIVENKLKAEKMLLDLGFSKDIRGEKLTLEDFAKLADYLGE
jgi:16S rRNA (adenine1518-N6/adenine1519-N6)-dimethyltransferase